MGIPPTPPRTYDAGVSADNLRASDADREKFIEQLRLAMGEGRLTVDEFDDRVQRIYASKTRAGMQLLVADLPAQRVSRPETDRRVPQWVVIMWIPWVCVNVLMVAIWLATGAGYFWPFWVAVPWGIALLIPTGIGISLNSGPKRR
ncbi:DUF1707 domain-containing protein [Nocardia callitridis]|uniref:DUF1707 domain-containing protein n=1 Tax=Nocardia callitridis TaxID=648753 RepID=A0ABP9L2P8_9NOCA